MGDHGVVIGTAPLLLLVGRHTYKTVFTRKHGWGLGLEYRSRYRARKYIRSRYSS